MFLVNRLSVIFTMILGTNNSNFHLFIQYTTIFTIMRALIYIGKRCVNIGVAYLVTLSNERTFYFQKYPYAPTWNLTQCSYDENQSVNIGRNQFFNFIYGSLKQKINAKTSGYIIVITIYLKQAILVSSETWFKRVCCIQ